MSNQHYLVYKTDFQRLERVSTAATALAAGAVRVRIDSFAFTANNITYAVFGDAMRYWGFYPTDHLEGVKDAALWGRIPVWGFGEVVESLHPEVRVGERLYGYWPMSNQVDLLPGRITATSFSDTASHRQELHSVYNQYQRCAQDPIYTAATEGVQSVLRPLFMTAWLIDDFLADNAFFGAHAVLLSSASSKTAYSAAFALHQRGGVQVVGLTSAANRAFCESLGCYSQVVTYDELDQIAADLPCVYVDMAGNGALRKAVHTRFGALKYSCSVGASHVNDLGGSGGVGSAKELPGPRATLFFAPAQSAKRAKEWGGVVFQQKLTDAWHRFVGIATAPQKPWIHLQTATGDAAIRQAYAQVLAGRDAASTGRVMVME